MSLPHIYLCRHGRTPWNAEGRLQGQVDIALDDVGREQAARNGRTLREALGADVAAYRFLASPMARTRETMEIVRGEIGLDPSVYDTDARLMELSFGDWQGSTLKEIGARQAPALADRETRKWTYVPPGLSAESYEMLARRVAPVFTGLDGPTVMVAHGGIARVVLQVFGGLTEAEAAHVPIPQDRILEIRDGRLDWV